eukprot:31270-Pelagococcus_subviridis.AAC.33
MLAEHVSAVPLVEVRGTVLETRTAWMYLTTLDLVLEPSRGANSADEMPARLPEVALAEIRRKAPRRGYPLEAYLTGHRVAHENP